MRATETSEGLGRHGARPAGVPGGDAAAWLLDGMDGGLHGHAPARVERQRVLSKQAAPGRRPHREGAQLPVACVPQRGVALKLPHLGHGGRAQRTAGWLAGALGTAWRAPRAQQGCRPGSPNPPAPRRRHSPAPAPGPPPPHQPLAAAGDAALGAAGPEVAQEVGHRGAHLRVVVVVVVSIRGLGVSSEVVFNVLRTLRSSQSCPGGLWEGNGLSGSTPASPGACLGCLPAASGWGATPALPPSATLCRPAAT